MHAWRKLGLLILGLVMVVIVAACTAKATPTPTPQPPTATPIPPTATPVPPTATPTPVPPTATPTATPRPGVTPPPATPTPTRGPATATPTPTAVAPTATPTPKPKQPLGGFPPVNTISDAEWAKIVEAAKKEGKLTCYCWDLRTYKADWVEKAFKAAYGIEIELMGFSGTIALERIRTEARAGKDTADIFDARMGYHFVGLENTGLLKRIDNLPVLKDAQNPDVFWANPIISPYVLEGPTSMSIPGITYIYNSNVMPVERLPKKWQDVLDPWYKGRLCEWDPITYAGIDYAVWGHFVEMGYPDWWPDYTYDLYAKQNDMHTLKILGQPNPLYTGECGLAVYVGGAISGANIKDAHTTDKATWIKGGTFDPPTPIRFNRGDGYSLLAKSPHPNAAMLFLNWFYSKEGGESYSKLGMDRTRRRDVPHLLEKQYYPAKQVTTFWVPDGPYFDFEQYSYANKGVFKLMKEGMSRDTWKKWMRDTSINFWGQYPPPAYPLYNFTEQELAP